MGTHVIAVVGATATGKSGLGIALAQELGGEVVNADSMQLYRGMDIGTAKLATAERRGVPHHLIADGAPLEVRRTRAGDAWERRRNAAVTPPPAAVEAATAPAPVLLGMPARRG